VRDCLPVARPQLLLGGRGDRDRPIHAHVHLHPPWLISHRPGTGTAQRWPPPPNPGVRPSPAHPRRRSRHPVAPAQSPRRPPPTTLPRASISPDAVYRQLARRWPADELAERYQAAYERGAGDLPAGEEPPENPITLLATAIPRLISLAVAANVLHLLPTDTHHGAGVAEELIATIDATATGSLHRAHLALKADGESRGCDTDEWLPLAYEQAADWLEHVSAAADPPPAIEHAQQAGRFAALAIGALDGDAPSVPETIADCLAHLLFTCVFAEIAARA
jgi:hypothetical protein